MRGDAMTLDMNEALHERMRKVMEYVAAGTNDQWARDYLLIRLEDLGFDRAKWFVRRDDGHYEKNRITEDG